MRPGKGHDLLHVPLIRATFDTGERRGLGGGGHTFARRLRAIGVTGLTCMLLLAYAGKTVIRNEDWVDEEKLFIAAQKVDDCSMLPNNSATCNHCIDDTISRCTCKSHAGIGEGGHVTVMATWASCVCLP